MKLKTIEIKDIRGIRSLTLHPNGRNFGIWGANGSGKSGIVDAIDFLLTGSMARLRGQGTAGISLQEHGSHIDVGPTGLVSAEFEFGAEIVTLTRSIASPKKLQIKGTISSEIRTVVDLASRGFQILTRREILRFITAEASARSKQVQEVLNLEEIEQTRGFFVRARNEREQESRATAMSLQQSRNVLAGAIGLPAYSISSIVDFINVQRTILGGDPITELPSASALDGLTSPVFGQTPETLNRAVILRDITSLREMLSDQSLAKIETLDSEIRLSIAQLSRDIKVRRNISRFELTESGLQLLDDSGSCPLCDTDFPPGELEAYLQTRLTETRSILSLQNEVIESSKNFGALVARTVGILQSLNKAIDALGMPSEFAELTQLHESHKRLLEVLGKPFTAYTAAYASVELAKRSFISTTTLDTLTKVEKTVNDTLKEATPQQIAWNALTRLDENVRRLREDQRLSDLAVTRYVRAKTAHDAFDRARTQILNQLYESVKARFVTLYKFLHEPDEGGFDADIVAHGPGVDLRVSFYNKGLHLPHALHSEGHQDSMGLCLYLALQEQLSGEALSLVVLDDVMMSIDSDHRRKICTLLKTFFGHKQFVITTHDRTWANILKTEGLIGPGGMIELYNWNIYTGPKTMEGSSFWESVQKKIDIDDIPGAAAELRRGLEEFFTFTCDAIGADVPFRVNGRYELGDLLKGAVSKFKSLLKKGKSAAQSWGDSAAMQRLTDRESTFTQTYSRTQIEQWAINATVHYNNWANLTKAELQPVVDAFEDLCASFQCSKCGHRFDVAKVEMEEVMVRCPCNAGWTLDRKKQAIAVIV